VAPLSGFSDPAVLLCRTGSAPLADLGAGGLHSIACLEFLLRAPPRSLQVCFGLGYDVNNWLRDLPRYCLQELWDSNVTYWKDYRIVWLPERWFEVKSVDGRYAKVTEVFGFFQSSFVAALESWGIGAPAEISRMKAERGTFRRADLERVRRYCESECGLLVELMGQLREACSEAGATPQSWIGAGSIAAALLNRHGVEPHHRYDLEIASKHVAEAEIAGAYYGGRFELLHQGVHRHVQSADLKSAYPAAATELPSLRGARLRRRKRFNPTRHGIWRVSWDLRGIEGAGGQGPETPLAPFPVRVNHAIFYPLAGTGFYHGVEVAAALELGYPVKVHYGWVLEGRQTAARPFAWVPEVFRARARFAREGRAAEKVIKLGLNSVYGKLAQGYAFKGRPKYQSYFWAGYITAATRARVLRLAAACTDPLMIAADGIYAGQLPHRLAGGFGRAGSLGSWERGEAERLFTAQAGVYEAVTDGRVSAKSRGFFASEVDYTELRHGFELEGIDYAHHYSSTRFCGLGAALQRRDFNQWRKWVTEPRSLLCLPERKVALPDGRLLPFPGFLESEPYQPKVSLQDARELDRLDGADQPMIME
jgi:hypothetical protein